MPCSRLVLPRFAALVALSTAGCATVSSTERCASPQDFARFLARSGGPDAADWNAFASGARSSSAARARAAVAYAETCALDRTVELTGALVAFPTVGVPKTNPKAFLDLRTFLASFAQNGGFEFRTFGNDDVFELAYGKGPAIAGLVMHGDVVPVQGFSPTSTISTETFRSPDWTHPPFRAERVGSLLYGRGTEDDKGPIAAALVALEVLSKFGWVPSGELRVILGNGEESNWDGMIAYARGDRVHPKHVISVDAGFPVVIAESGFVDYGLSFHSTSNGSADSVTILEAEGGQFLTQVPGEAFLKVSMGSQPASTLEKVRAAIARASQELGPRFRASIEQKDAVLIVHTAGEAVHSSVADDGANALWMLATIAQYLQPEPNAAFEALAAIREGFVGDHFGRRLNLAYQHPKMLDLLVAPTLLRATATSATLRVNMRRPAGKTAPEFRDQLTRATQQLRRVAPSIMMAEDSWVGEPALADTDGAMVPALLEIFRRRAHDPGAKAVAIRGGTFARLFPGAVSFGPSLPGRPYRGHAPDEYVELDALELLVPALVEALIAAEGW